DLMADEVCGERRHFTEMPLAVPHFHDKVAPLGVSQPFERPDEWRLGIPGDPLMAEPPYPPGLAGGVRLSTNSRSDTRCNGVGQECSPGDHPSTILIARLAAMALPVVRVPRQLWPAPRQSCPPGTDPDRRRADGD